MTLREALGRVPDPRKAQGKRHPLEAILALAVGAMLCGARSLYTIASGAETMGRRAHVGVAEQVPCNLDPVCQEVIELPGHDSTGVRPAVVSPSTQPQPFGIVS